MAIKNFKNLQVNIFSKKIGARVASRMIQEWLLRQLRLPFSEVGLSNR